MNLLRKLCLYALVGLLAGISSSVLILSLESVTHVRETYRFLVFLLPCAGFVSGWMYEKFGQSVSSGNALIFEEIHNPKSVIPFRMIPLVYVNTLLTHLFGGSAGREGTAVQMGSSLSDQLSHVFHVAKNDRKTLLKVGLSAAFGSALGAPWAGMCFGMEVTLRGRLDYRRLLPCLIGSWVGFRVAHSVLYFFHERPEYPQVSSIMYDFKTVAAVVLLGVLSGVWALFFSKAVHLLENFFKNNMRLRWQMCCGGALVVAFYSLCGFEYAGLGIPLMKKYFLEISPITVPLYKMIATLLTVGSGFKGGEFVPLVFMGSTLGSAVAGVLGVSIPLLAALGFGSVFAGAANVPLTCGLLLVEMFGMPIAPYAAMVCYLSYVISGRVSIYKGQK